MKPSATAACRHGRTGVVASTVSRWPRCQGTSTPSGASPSPATSFSADDTYAMLAAFAVSAIAFSVNPISMGVTTNPAARMTHVRMDAGVALKVCALLKNVYAMPPLTNHPFH